MVFICVFFVYNCDYHYVTYARHVTLDTRDSTLRPRHALFPSELNGFESAIIIYFITALVFIVYIFRK